MATENSILSSIKQQFPKTSREDWKRTASQEAGGRDPDAELQWKSADNIAFAAYYDNESTTKLDYLKNFDNEAAQNSFLGARQWFNTPLVTVTDELTANKISLNHLANGADGIIFNFAEKKDFDLSRLLQNIEWPYCSLSFETTEGNFFENILRDFITKNYTDSSSLAGSLFWNKFPDKIDLNFFFQSTKNFKPLGLKVSTSTPVNEIAEALTQSVKFFDQHVSQPNAYEIFSAINFSLPVGTNFLEDISKLKSLRMLWFQISQACGFRKYQPSDLKVHARSESWIKENYQPHGNMIKETSAAIAAILGGCASLTILPEDEKNEMMSRAARNVSNILREESHLSKVADAVAGSYAIENIQHEMAQKAWSLFQSNMKNG